MKLEFLICASPTDGFFAQIAFFRMCLDKLGGDYAQARLVAVFGDHSAETIPARWKPHFSNIEVHWAHPPGAFNQDHLAQHEIRFDLLDPTADFSCLCDADTAILNPMDDLLAQLQLRPALAGVMAHYHFPWPGRDRDPARDWTELALASIGRDIERPHRYSFEPRDTPPSAPFYINYGLFAGPPAMLSAFHKRDLSLRPSVANLVGHWWAPQVSLALACIDLGLPTLSLPMRYNFPNDPHADALYPEELGEVVLMHYLRENRFSRSTVFADETAFRKLLNLDLAGSNAVFQDFVRTVTHNTYPFAE